MQHPSAVPVPPVKQGEGTVSKHIQRGGRGREREGEGEKMQANPAYLPIEMSYESQESKYINVPN